MKPDFYMELELAYYDNVEFRLAVWYDYQPPEDATHNYPGCAASIDIGTVERVVEPDEDIQHRLYKDEVEAVEQACWDHEESKHSSREAMAEDRAEAAYEARKERKMEQIAAENSYFKSHFAKGHKDEH